MLFRSILIRNPKEGFLGKVFKNVSKGVQSAVKSVDKNVFTPIQNNVFTPIKTNVFDAIVDLFKKRQRELELAREKARALELEREKARLLELAKKKCENTYTILKTLLSEKSVWEKKIKDLTNKYYDKNFNMDLFNFYQNELFILNNIIDENSKLNNDVNSLLTQIEILQTDNKIKIDNLISLNTNLKECQMNKELTEHDYIVLR